MALVLCPQLQNITSYPHLLTVHDFEQDSSEDLETVILKALVKGEGLAAHPQEGLPRAPGKAGWPPRALGLH